MRVQIGCYTHGCGWSLLVKNANEEIGARFKRWRLQTVGEYVSQMRECWSEIDRVLRPGAYCAVVLGESRRFPGTAEQTLTDLSKLMSRVSGPVTRNPSRRRVSDRGANEAVENLLRIPKDMIIALFGPTCTGKTTLGRCMGDL